jgi:hypothetical protein
MKLKYYLRGLGIGIIVTTIILMISFSRHGSSMSDEEIIARASELGMVMQEEQDNQDKEEQSEPIDLDNPTETEENTESTEKTDEALMPDTEAGKEESENFSTGSDEQEENLQEPLETDDAQLSGEVYRLTIQRGEVCRDVCEHLAAAGVIDDAESFRRYLSEIGYASHISVGEYDVPYGLSMDEVAEVLQAGPIQQ